MSRTQVKMICEIFSVVAYIYSLVWLHPLKGNEFSIFFSVFNLAGIIVFVLVTVSLILTYRLGIYMSLGWTILHVAFHLVYLFEIFSPSKTFYPESRILIPFGLFIGISLLITLKIYIFIGFEYFPIKDRYQSLKYMSGDAPDHILKEGFDPAVEILDTFSSIDQNRCVSL
jgi:hypothetical protein